MMTLEKALERLAEFKRKKEKKDRIKKEKERARIKAEKKRQKLKEKAKASKKIRKKIYNTRYRTKQRKKIDDYRKKTGDEKGSFSIYLMKDGVRVKFFARRRYKNPATQLYYKILEENNSKVAFNQKCVNHHYKIIERKYELILTQKIREGEDDHVTLLRNKEGKFIENYFTDDKGHKILIKNDWFVEDSFWVYGFDGIRDRKDFNYIYNNIILKHTDNYTRIFVHGLRLIHHYDNDFDMVICRNKEHALELYDAIEKKLDKKKYPTIFFMGVLSGGGATWFLDELEEKTGWPRRKCIEGR